MPEATRVFAVNMQAVADGDAALDNILKDAGRATARFVHATQFFVFITAAQKTMLDPAWDS